MSRTILRLQQIHERTGVPIETLRYWRKLGTGPRTFVLGNRVVAFEDDIDAWIEQEHAATAVGGAA